MKNTLENKAKFFAQYWGQFVVDWGSSSFIGKLTHERFSDYQLKHSHLELTPLSQISDEDAIEAANIIDYNHGRNRLAYIKVGKYVCNNILELGEITPKRAFELIDFLRSKSYALPFNGLSVEDQIEYGWVKLKTKK